MVSLVDPERSNPKPLNGSQFSQGTLFKPPKPSAEHRWAAHGYSPERRAEISKAVPLRIGVSKTWGEGQSPMYPSQTIGIANQRRATRAAVVDTLARSSMPASDLARNTPKMKVAPMNYAYGQMASRGMLQRGPQGVSVTPMQGNITLHPYGAASRTRGGAEHTLIHEIGHHVDFESDPTKFHTTAQTEMRRGGSSPSLEGAAEGYAAKHHVPRRNAPETYAQTASYEDLHNSPSFQYHFQRVSGRELGEAMGKKPEHMGPQFVQEHLFNPHAAESY